MWEYVCLDSWSSVHESYRSVHSMYRSADGFSALEECDLDEVELNACFRAFGVYSKRFRRFRFSSSLNTSIF